MRAEKRRCNRHALKRVSLCDSWRCDTSGRRKRDSRGVQSSCTGAQSSCTGSQFDCTLRNRVVRVRNSTARSAIELYGFASELHGFTPYSLVSPTTRSHHRWPGRHFVAATPWQTLPRHAWHQPREAKVCCVFFLRCGKGRRMFPSLTRRKAPPDGTRPPPHICSSFSWRFRRSILVRCALPHAILRANMPKALSLPPSVAWASCKRLSVVRYALLVYHAPRPSARRRRRLGTADARWSGCSTANDS